MDDGGDCDGQCSGVCESLFLTWNYLFGYGVYAVNHSVACSLYWDDAVAMGNYEIAMSDKFTINNCSDSLSVVDFNGDRVLNFREYIVIALSFDSYSWAKHLGYNCSACTGMENYNPYHG